MTAVLEARNVQVVYGDRVALDVEHLALHRGETLALIGPNGAGKSTLLRVLALLQAPARGEVWFEGAPVARRDLLAVRRRLAVVFQEPLLRDASVWDNVATGLWFRGERGPSARKKVEAWLERLGLTHLAHRSARTLSGGEARRVSLARALVLDPEVLLLDEPLSALDAPTREALVADLEALLRDAGTTTLLVTHERSEALLLGTRVGVLVDGRLRQIDTPAKVFGAPVDEEVAAFVGVENVWEGQVVHETDGLATLRVGAGEVRVAGSFTTG
jgi:tungstate transport system ATP-binding protein